MAVGTEHTTGLTVHIPVKNQQTSLQTDEFRSTATAAVF
jgi:hypothetical protein